MMPHQVRLAWILIKSLVLSFGIICVSAKSWSLERRPAIDPSSQCAFKPSRLLYRASFEWNGESMLFVIDRQTAKSRNSKNPGPVVARIYSGEGCQLQAICFGKPDSAAKSAALADSRTTDELDLRCQGARLNRLSSPATLILKSETGSTAKDVLRFGSWLEGYRPTELSVEMNEFSSPVSSNTSRSPIRKPASKFVQAPRRGNP